MSKLSKSLELLKQYLRDTPIEKVQRLIDEVDKLEMPGPRLFSYGSAVELSFDYNASLNQVIMSDSYEESFESGVIVYQDEDIQFEPCPIESIYLSDQSDEFTPDTSRKLSKAA